ncbi:MAG TPA: LysR substrate-binding domain-containing protein [Microbacterium sp.]|nr:LysR substrate-binding domain-containing protein [Microbacterium sp.]
MALTVLRRRPSPPDGYFRAMAKGSGGAKRRAAARTPRPARKRDAAPAAAAETPAAPSGPFRLGAVPGATPGTWIDRWQQRRANPLELVPLTVAGQRGALETGAVHAALVRLPIDGEGLHVIPLYEEVPVVVVAADSHLTAADELEASDLADEVVIVPRDDVLAMPLPDGAIAPTFDAPETTADAIATVAAGVGVVVVPMSLARLHHRRDTEYRLLRDGPRSSVALAWAAERTTADVQAFVGIVRGRTPNSSR